MKNLLGTIYYDVEEISGMLGVCTETVRRLFRTKQINGIKKGGAWYATKQAVKDYIISIN